MAPAQQDACHANGRPKHGLAIPSGRTTSRNLRLSYYRARYYDQSVGRFLNEDPLGFGAEINFYRYVSNNPVLRTDPFGLQSKDEGWFWNLLNKIWNKAINPPPGGKQPMPVNICEKGQLALFWESGPNPYVKDGPGWGAYDAFTKAFSKKCADAKTAGKTTTTYCSAGFTPMGGPYAFCMCCESPCEKKK